jgi:capsular exopolysaccharide synthesis family protein
MLSGVDSTPKCIAISSANPRQGKTFLAAALGAVLSSKREKTVIIDADLRLPRLHEVFGLSKTDVGLADFLCSDEVQVDDILRFSTIPGVFYITSGSKTADPVDLLQSDRLTDLVEQLRSRFDHIVFDCPPVLGFADVFMLGLHTDGLIMVVRQGAVRREDLKEAIRVFSSANACPLLGVVMNKVDFPKLCGYRFGEHYLGFHKHYYVKS